ncbi:MAG TPA: histidine phosphatase family protein [Clostridium sp.]|nr:histidine phosphatase family protein [Clostridium sp.]
MKRIITIQHTQSIHHTNGMVGSWTDWELTELGKEEAKNIGIRLKEELNGENYIVYSSDLKRASQTAAIVCSYLGVKPIYDTRLREKNLGIACGKSAKWYKENRRVEENCDVKPFDDAESRREAYERIKSFYDMIVNSSDENIIVVSHGGILSLFNLVHLGMKPEDTDYVIIHGRSGGVSFMRITDDNKHFMDKMSDMSYKSDI